MCKYVVCSYLYFCFFCFTSDSSFRFHQSFFPIIYIKVGENEKREANKTKRKNINKLTQIFAFMETKKMQKCIIILRAKQEITTKYVCLMSC